jgi:endonuclease YncB( thermonuclease family)
MKRFTSLLAVLLLLLAVVPARAQEKPKTDPQLVLGTFELEAGKAVVDGDTIKVVGLKESLRLLCLDAEETFKQAKDRREAAENFEAYLAEKSAGEGLPVKFPTWIGEDAKDYCEKFFKDVKKVRLEYDTTRRKIDYYGRHLCYVFATPKGEKAEKNYNVELVRAGLSPYSMKYGHSLRFREQFEAAEQEARKARRGIWAEKPRGYRDYDKRLTWWNERALQIMRFEEQLATEIGSASVMLGDDDTDKALEKFMGETVTLFGGVAEHDAVFADADPPYVVLGHRNKQDVYVYFESKDLLKRANPARHQGFYVKARGKLEKRDGRWCVTVKDGVDFVKG